MTETDLNLSALLTLSSISAKQVYNFKVRALLALALKNNSHGNKFDHAMHWLTSNLSRQIDIISFKWCKDYQLTNNFFAALCTVQY